MNWDPNRNRLLIAYPQEVGMQNEEETIDSEEGGETAEQAESKDSEDSEASDGD